MARRPASTFSDVLAGMLLLSLISVDIFEQACAHFLPSYESLVLLSLCRVVRERIGYYNRL